MSSFIDAGRDHGQVYVISARSATFGKQLTTPTAHASGEYRAAVCVVCRVFIEVIPSVRTDKLFVFIKTHDTRPRRGVWGKKNSAHACGDVYRTFGQLSALASA